MSISRISVPGMLLVLLLAPLAFAQEVPIVYAGKPVAIVVADDKLDPLAARAVELFTSRISERTGAKLDVAPKGESLKFKALPSGYIYLFVQPPDAKGVPLAPESYVISTTFKSVTVTAADSHGLLYGVGALLRQLHFTKDSVSMPVLDKPITASPWLARRDIYYACHNHNDYDTGPLEGVKRDLEDAALWGVNSMHVWLFPVEHYRDFTDPVQKEDAGLRHWNLVITMMKEARALGMKTGIILCSNDCFTNYVTPELRAKGGVAINVNALACPSIPAGRAAILKTRDIIFRLAKEQGAVIDSVVSFSVDTGGCKCDKCKPWLDTYLKLMDDTVVVAHKYYPGLKFYLVNWYWNSQGFTGNIVGELRDHPRDWFAGIASLNGVKAPIQPENTLAFMNYGSQYYFGLHGANPMGERLSKDFKRLRDSKTRFVQEYCEGRYQNLNNSLYARLGFDADLDPKAVFAEYARYHFGVSPEAAAQFAEASVLIGRETPGYSEYHWNAEFSKTIYDAAVRCEKERIDWPNERYYWDLFNLRARSGHLARLMGSVEDLKALKETPDPVRIKAIDAAYKEFANVTNSFNKTYAIQITTPLTVPQRYNIVWGKDLYAQWLPLFNALPK